MPIQLKNILVPTDFSDCANAAATVGIQLAKQFLLARITHKSVDRLQLIKGQKIYVQIKTAALLSDRPLPDKLIGNSAIPENNQQWAILTPTSNSLQI